MSIALSALELATLLDVPQEGVSLFHDPRAHNGYLIETMLCAWPKPVACVHRCMHQPAICMWTNVALRATLVGNSFSLINC